MAAPQWRERESQGPKVLHVFHVFKINKETAIVRMLEWTGSEPRWVGHRATHVADPDAYSEMGIPAGALHSCRVSILHKIIQNWK